MICYEFPPLNSPGSRRYIQFARDLPKLGWKPIILTIRNPSRFFTSLLDTSIRIPKNLKIYRSLELPTIYIWKVINRLTKFSITSFPYCGWILHTVYMAYKIIKKEQIDLIFSTVFPYSAVFIGVILKGLTKKPLIIDFRDPPGKMHSLERKLWDKCIPIADLNTSVTKSMQQIVYTQRKHVNFAVIPNGYGAIPKIPAIKFFPEEKFIIVYTGQIFLDWAPVLKNFLLAIKEFVKSQKNLVLAFVGDNHDKIFNLLISEIKLDLNTFELRLLGHLPYETCISLVRQASVNLIFRPSVLNYALGSKIFDYLHSDVPVLGILDDVNETARFIKKGNLGIIAPNDPKSILAALNRLLKERHFQKNWNFLKNYNREGISKKLAKLFDIIIENYL